MCVIGCDIDKKARETYLKNYGADTKFIDNIRTLTDYLFSSNEKIKEIEKQIKNRKNYLDKVSKSITELQLKLSTENDNKKRTKITKDISTKQKKQKEYESSIASLNTELEQCKEIITNDKNRELSEKLKLFEEHINEQFPEDVDVICGGFPCQPFSNGGKKLALEDDRGDLFFNIMYLARVKKPKFMFLENVKHLMTVKDGEVFRLILKTLKENG